MKISKSQYTNHKQYPKKDNHQTTMNKSQTIQKRKLTGIERELKRYVEKQINFFKSLKFPVKKTEIWNCILFGSGLYFQ